MEGDKGGGGVIGSESRSTAPSPRERGDVASVPSSAASLSLLFPFYNLDNK